MIFNTSFSNITVLKISVPIPTRTGGTLTYNGSVQSPTWDYDSSLVKLVSGNSGTDAGIYNTVFELYDPSQYMWEDKGTANKSIQWEIERATISEVPSQSGTLTYNGNVQSATWDNYDSNKMTTSGTTSAIDADTYTIEFTPTSNYKWSDESIGAKNVQWTIGKKSIANVPSQSGTLTYNGNTLTPTWNNYNPLELDISGDTSGVNAGDYTAVFTPNKNCKWGESELIPLPNGYTQVDYIENPNFGYTLIDNIDGYGIVNTVSIDMKISYVSDSAALTDNSLATATNAIKPILGGKYFTNSTGESFGGVFGANGKKGYFKFLDTSTYQVAQEEIIADKPYKILLNPKEKTVSINGKETNIGSFGTTTTRHYPPLALFAYNQTGSNADIYAKNNFKAYYFKFYNESTEQLICHLVPCINDSGVAGFYDLISDKFLISLDSDKQFVAGPETTSSSGTSSVNVTWSIERATVSVAPSQSGELTYNGNVLSPSWENYDPNTLDIGGNTSGTNAGNYDATFTPNSNCKWWDGTTTSKTVTWVISKADVTITVNPTSLSLDENNTNGTITVTRNSTGAITATSSDTSVATVEVDGTTITVTGLHTGDINISVSVASDDNYNAGSAQVPVTSTVPRMYTVTADIEPSGKGTVDGLGTYAEGSTVTLTAHPEVDYKFKGWKVVTNNVPDNYSEVEYVETNNYTRLNTKVRPSTPSNIRVVMDMMPLEKVSAYRYIYTGFFGTNPYSLPTVMLRQNNSNNSMAFQSGVTNTQTASTGITNFTYDLVANTRITIDADPANNTIKLGNSTFSVSPLTVGNQPNAAFCIGCSPAQVTTESTLKMRIYSMKMYDGETLISDFIPCKNKETGEYSLYDKVNEEFTSVLQGSVTGGVEIAPTEEIISTDSIYTFTIYQNTHLTAVFKEIVPEYTISATVNPDGSGTVTGAGVYEENTEVTLAATANDGYQFVDWAEKGESRLPNGYTELEYIQSSGTQYIDTGVIPNNNTRITAKFRFISATTNFFSIFGVEGADGYNGYMLFGRNGQTGVQGIYGDEYYTVTGGAYSTSSPNEIDINGNTLTLDGKSQTLPVQTFTCDAPIYLFCSDKYSSSGTSAPQQLTSTIFYYFTVYDGDTLIRNFIPCSNPSGTIGMYDLVNDTFYANAGTGEFTAGEENSTEYQLSIENPYVFEAVRDIDVVANFEEQKSRLPDGYTEVEYIESTGTQYIDLGVLLSEKSSIEIDVTPLALSSNAILGLFDRSGNTTSTYRFTQFYLNSYSGIVVGISYKASNSSVLSSALTNSAGSRISLLIDLKNKTLIGNGNLTELNTPTGFETTCPLYLFGTHRRFLGVSQAVNNKSSARLYSLKIYNNEVLSHEYIPCVNPSGVIGLYDSVEKLFLQNFGTGTFTVGPEISQ